jgi:hypothetical protein
MAAMNEMIRVVRADYYPPESEVGPSGQGGIVATELEWIDVQWGVQGEDLVTISVSNECRGDDVYSYEFDVTFDEAERLITKLAEATRRVREAQRQ